MYEATDSLQPDSAIPLEPPPTTLNSRRHDVVAVAVLVVLTSVLFGNVLIGRDNLYMRDLTRYYYPTKQVLREIVSNGEFPFWNRYFSAGQPIAANPEHEVFYPLTWLILLPSYDFGYRLHILIHIYIGLLSMYALLRSMELGAFASFFGALSWGLGGLYMSYVNLLPILFCAAWLPLTCLFVRRFFLTHRVRDFALGALALGLQFLVAEPTTIMQTGLLLGMYALYRAWSRAPRLMKAITRVLWIALFSATGLLVGAAQVLPAIDHVHDSARSRPFGFDLVSAWSMPWAKFAEFVYPNILGHLSIGHVTWYWAGGLYPGMGSAFLFSIYAGVMVASLAVGGAFARPRGGRLVLLLVLISLVLALGSHTPLLKLLYDAGLATNVRYPEKFLLIAVFTVTVFAAQMLERLLAGDEDVRQGALGFAFAVFAVAAVISVVAFTPLYARGMAAIWGISGPTAKEIVAISRRDWIFGALRGAGAVALLLTLRFRQSGVWKGAFAAFLCADLLPIGREVNPTMPRRFFDPPPIAATLPNDHADYRLFHESDWYGQEEIARKFFSTGSGVYWVVRNGLFPMTPAGAGVRTVLERDYDKTALLPTIDLTDSVWDVKRSGRADWYVPFMAMSNAWYRAEYVNFDKEQKRNHGDWTRSIPVRFTPAPHYPRYYFADQLVTIHDRKDFVAKLTSGSYSERVAFMTRPAFVPGRGVVRHVSETANSAVLDVDSVGQTFLVMSITPHKYWSITIDGRTAPAVITNIAYQGLVITPGSHRIVMRYENPLVEIGAGISGATLLLLLVMIVRRPRRPAEESGLAAYQEPMHVIATDDGTRVEPAAGGES